ncbi:MAG: type II/IV secretion system ATPase subunit, partial [Candidatus Methanomethylicaceae archaeon]
LGTLSLEVAAYLWFAIENKSSILIAGEVASGKTTMLNCTSMFIRPDMKIVSIEETPELNLPHTNWIPMATRTGFGRKTSDITLFELLKNALRQRPDYIIVGEVRGEEAFTLFQALATGHGVQATIHADTPEKVISRLESEPMNVPRPLIGLLDIIIVQSRVKIGDKPARRTLRVSEIKGYDSQSKEIFLNNIVRWDPSTDRHLLEGESEVLKRIAEKKGMRPEDVKSEVNKRKVVLNWMIKKGMRRYMEIGNVMREYYADSEGLFKRALVESLEETTKKASVGFE